MINTMPLQTTTKLNLNLLIKKKLQRFALQPYSTFNHPPTRPRIATPPHPLPPSGADNVRMAMETCAVFAHATGRTLVLPPSQPLYLLHLKNKRHSFGDFFPLEDIPLDTLEVKLK